MNSEAINYNPEANHVTIVVKLLNYDSVAIEPVLIVVNSN